jgi:glycosyl transferase, family 25
MQTKQMPIFVINLDGSTDRLDMISARLDELGLVFERVPAVRGALLSETEKRKICPWRPWRYARTDGEIGCYLSHLKAIRAVADSGLERAIILEDDAAFDEDFARIAANNFSMPLGVDVLKLEGFNFDRKKIIALREWEKGRTFSFVNKPTFGSAAYMITWKGASKALETLSVMRDQFDSDLFCYWRSGLTICDLLPYPVKQEHIASDTHEGQRSPSSKFLMNLFRVPIKRYERVKQRRSEAYAIEFLSSVSFAKAGEGVKSL